MNKDLEFNFKLNYANKSSVNITNDDVIFNADIKDKITSPCPYFNKCGNCQLLELNYNAQLDLKTKFVKKLFSDFDVEVQPTQGQYYNFKYRNKLHLCFSYKNKQLCIGFIKENTNIVKDIPNCLMHEDWYQKLYIEIKQYITKSKISIYNKQTKLGNLKYVVARVIDNSIMLIVVQKDAYYNGLKQLYTNLTKYFKNVSLYININNSNTNLVLTDNFKYIDGNKFINAKLNDIKFNLGVKSFFQVNTEITSKIYSQVLSLVKQTNVKNIIDCFSGIGITSCVFAKNGYTVQSVEIVKNACKNALTNAKINNLEDKIEIFNADAITKINELSSQKESVLFVDPARNGLTKDFISNINFKNIKQIIYLSCNPKTLVEDMNLLNKLYNFKPTFVKGFDMFCNTKHIEILTMLERK